MKDGTKNLSGMDLDRMQNYPNQRANAIGRKVPYYLRYAREGKPIIKPGVKYESEGNV
jgi:hypothetical protein